VTSAVEIKRRYDRERQRAIAAGTWQPMVGIDVVRAHVVGLHDAGLSARAIAAAAGVSLATVSAILWPQHVDARSRGVTHPVAVALLAVTGSAQVPPTALVPAVGTHRRVRALQRLGWTTRLIAADCGVPHQTLTGTGPKVRKHHADAVAAAYDRLCMRPGPSSRTRRLAARAGWPPPLAWDDDQLDDPAATPTGHLPATGVHLDLDELMHLAHGGESIARAVARCGVSVSAAERMAQRQHRVDVLAALAGVRAAQRSRAA
jgi:hypothetical protein